MARVDQPHAVPTDARRPEEPRELVGSGHPLLGGESAIRTVLDTVGDGFSIVDEQQKFLFVNSAGERCFGAGLGGLKGRNLTEFVPPGSVEVIREQVSTRRQGHASTYDLEIVREDGEVRQLLVTASPRFSADQEFRGALAVFRDVTDRTQVEKDLRESLSRLEGLVHERTRDLHGCHDLLRVVTERTSDVVFAKDLDGRYRMVNRAACKLLGRTAEQVIGRTDHEILPRDQADLLKSGDERVIELGESITEEAWSVNRGDWTFLVDRALLRDADGNASGILGIARDVTEFKEVQRHSRQVEDLATIGALTVDLFREINKPLKTIRTLAESIVETDGAGASPEVLAAARAIVETTNLAEEIVKIDT